MLRSGINLTTASWMNSSKVRRVKSDMFGCLFPLVWFSLSTGVWQARTGYREQPCTGGWQIRGRLHIKCQSAKRQLNCPILIISSGSAGLICFNSLLFVKLFFPSVNFCESLRRRSNQSSATPFWKQDYTLREKAPQDLLETRREDELQWCFLLSEVVKLKYDWHTQTMVWVFVPAGPSLRGNRLGFPSPTFFRATVSGWGRPVCLTIMCLYV